jgi:hypothetical protein
MAGSTGALLAVALLALVLLVVLLVVGWQAGSTNVPVGRPNTPPAAPVSTAVETTSRIYVGVSCPEPNSIRCGRIGIAIWPNGSVDDLKAQIGPYAASLRESGDHFEGFVTANDLSAEPFAIHASDAGRWIGDPPARVDLRVTGSADGARIDVTFRADIAAGWG